MHWSCQRPRPCLRNTCRLESPVLIEKHIARDLAIARRRSPRSSDESVWRFWKTHVDPVTLSPEPAEPTTRALKRITTSIGWPHSGSGSGCASGSCSGCSSAGSGSGREGPAQMMQMLQRQPGWLGRAAHVWCVQHGPTMVSHMRH